MTVDRAGGDGGERRRMRSGEDSGAVVRLGGESSLVGPLEVRVEFAEQLVANVRQEVALEVRHRLHHHALGKAQRTRRRRRDGCYGDPAHGSDSDTDAGPVFYSSTSTDCGRGSRESGEGGEGAGGSGRRGNGSLPGEGCGSVERGDGHGGAVGVLVVIRGGGVRAGVVRGGSVGGEGRRRGQAALER